VLILKGVKVVCFDILLEVLILKEMEERPRISEKRDVMGSPSGSRAAEKLAADGGMPPRVFCRKRLQTIENKEKEWQKNGQESCVRGSG